MKALILIDHGSKSPQAHEDLVWLQKQIQSHIDSVFIAHMEIASPNLGDAIQEALKHGATHISIFPLFLVQGKHLSKDIPMLVQEKQIQFPEISIQLIDGLRKNPLLSQLIIDSIR